MNQQNLNQVDWSLIPEPRDDGGTLHLAGTLIPGIALPSTGGGLVDVGSLPGCVILYFYPMTGQPGVPLPDGWDDIPGARGCTPQSCSFRDHDDELRSLGVQSIFGVSTQSPDYQAEAATRLHLPFHLLSDEHFALTFGLKLPTMDVGPLTLLKRLTLVVTDRVIEKVFYPVFPPDRNASDVVEYLKGR